MDKEGNMNRIEKITIILANLVTVIEKRGDYNLDEYSKKIASLYSSQEPQKVVCPKDCEYKPCDNDPQKGDYCPLNRRNQAPSTPASEGMELSELSPQEIAQAKRDSIKGQIVQTDMVTIGARAQLKKDQAQVAKVLSNLPTEQEIRIKELVKQNNNLYFQVMELEKQVNQLHSEKETLNSWLYLFEALQKAFYEYEMDVDLEPPSKHIKMMQDLESLITKLKSGQSPKEV
jgi:hypothetical protein